jgi:hypothetical protein
MMRNLLTTPNPAAGTPQTGGQPVGQQIGGGIAGIASKSEEPSIMVYNDHTNYNEWEFIFDFSKQRPLTNTAGTTIGTPAATLGTTGSSFGTPASTLGAPAGGMGNGPGTLPGGSPGLTGFGAATGPGAAPAAGLPGQPPGTQGQNAPGQQKGGGAQNQKQPLPTSMRPGRP